MHNGPAADGIPLTGDGFPRLRRRRPHCHTLTAISIMSIPIPVTATRCLSMAILVTAILRSEMAMLKATHMVLAMGTAAALGPATLTRTDTAILVTDTHILITS